MAAVGTPPALMVALTLVEVPAVPFLIFWQYRVERARVRRINTSVEPPTGSARG